MCKFGSGVKCENVNLGWRQSDGCSISAQLLYFLGFGWTKGKVKNICVWGRAHECLTSTTIIIYHGACPSPCTSLLKDGIAIVWTFGWSAKTFGVDLVKFWLHTAMHTQAECYGGSKSTPIMIFAALMPRYQQRDSQLNLWRIFENPS